MTNMTTIDFTLVNKNALTLEKNTLISRLENEDYEIVKIMFQTRINEIDTWMNEYEKINSNYSKFMEYLLTDDIKETQTTTTDIYNERKVLTYAPTQVGKTNAIIKIVKDCVSRGISIVISSDNKKDQMIQLFNRLVKAVEENYETIFKDCFITTVDNKNFESITESMKDHSTFVICCLDNKTQIQKTYEKIMSINENQNIKSMCIIHDEGDVTTKSRNITEITNQPESHKKWMEFVQKTSNKGIIMKRVFVTATPENVIYIHKPGYLWNLSIPDNYVGHKKIHFNELNDFSSKQITSILSREVRLRKEEGGIILYCVERNKDSDEDDNNQMTVFIDMISNLKKTGLDAVSVYNSDGIKVVFRLKKQKTMFINKIETLDLKYTMENEIITISKKDIVISKFYGYLQSCECKVVLTIGKDLISRGISFVSDCKENPLTATSMIYKPGNTLHCVALCQAIGRLTGTAQSKLLRRLYTTDDVYSNYMTLVQNQIDIISMIVKNNNKIDAELTLEFVANKMSRPIDRKALKLEKDMLFWEETEDTEESGYGSDEEETEIDGVNLLKMNRWRNEDSLVGRMINYLYENDETISFEEFKNGIGYEKSYEDFRDNIRGGCSLKSKYGKLWNYKNNNVSLNKKIRKYISNN